MGLLGMICLIVRFLVWRRTARTLRTGGSLGLLLPNPLVEEGDWWLFADVFFCCWLAQVGCLTMLVKGEIPMLVKFLVIIGRVFLPFARLDFS